VASEKREKMPLEQRAKLFMPFAALRGLEEALEKKREEMLKENKIILSEDGIMEVDNLLRNLKKGDEVFLSYYDGDRYKNKKGFVDKIDRQNECILMEKEPIYFSSILSIRKEKE